MNKAGGDSQMLELYQFEECPYCAKVRSVLTDLGLSYVTHNVPRDREKRDELEKISGQRFVPVLFDSGAKVMIADDEVKIINYLKEKYKWPAK